MVVANCQETWPCDLAGADQRPRRIEPP